MAEKNSLWKNIRKKAEQNRRTGATPKKPTAEMLKQERKIKAQYAVGGYLDNKDDDVFKYNQNQGSTVGKTSQDWLANWVQDPEFARRLNRNFPSSAGDLEKKIYGVKEARERASAANLKNINKVIPYIVSDIYDTQFLYNTNPEINTGLLSSYKSRLEDPKSIKALEKNLSTNPQGFTDEQGRIIITNEANTQYGPQSVALHELIHKVSERDKTLDKLFKGKFQTPSQDKIDANYDKDEMYPFLMQMRFDNNFQPGEEITPERLKQIRDSGYKNHLFRYYNDDEISKYLNTLASNQTQAPMQYAAQGGYMYPDGGTIDPTKGTKVLNRDGLLIAPALPEFEVIENLTDEEKFRIEKYNERLNQQKAFQEKWYPGQEYDPSNIERRASIYADDATAKYILDNHASRNNFANRQEYLRSFSPYQKNIIKRSNYAGNFEPDMGSRFRRGLGLLMGTRSSLTNPDSDLSAEDYANRNFFSNIGDIFSPATYFLNLGKGAATGTFASALRGKPSNPLVDATDMVLGNEEDVWKYNTQGDIAIDPLNFAGMGIGSSLYDDLGKVGKYLTTKTPLKETWRLNPWSFQRKVNELNPSKQFAYRTLGRQEGFENTLKSGSITPKPGGSYHTQHDAAFYNVGHPLYRYGEDFDVVNGAIIAKSGPKYIAEVPLSNPKVNPRYIGREDKYRVTQGVDAGGLGHVGINEPGVTIYKEDWLRGYKPVKTPKQVPSPSIIRTSESTTPTTSSLNLERPIRDGSRSKSTLFKKRVDVDDENFKIDIGYRGRKESDKIIPKEINIKGKSGKWNISRNNDGTFSFHADMASPFESGKALKKLDELLPPKPVIHDQGSLSLDSYPLLLNMSRRSHWSPEFAGYTMLNKQHKHSNLFKGLEPKKSFLDMLESNTVYTFKDKTKANEAVTRINELLKSKGFKEKAELIENNETLSDLIKKTYSIKLPNYKFTRDYKRGGPMYYDVGGKVWKNIAAGLYGAGEGILDTVTMGATDQLTDKGFDWLTKVGNKNINLDDPDDVKFLKTQQQIKGYGNTAGAIGTAVVTGNVQGAIGQGTKGLNTAFQASDWASDDFKKWSQGISGVAGMAAGFAGGLNSDSFNAAAKAGTGIAGFGQKAGKIGSFGNQVTGMFGGNQQPLWQQGEQRQELLNSPEYLAMKERENQAYVNQGLSFAANGGPVNNNLLTLQTGSMRENIKNHRKKYSKGGTFQKFGINEIPDSAGYHHENAYGGVPIGPNAMAEGGEFVLDNNYVVSDEVDGMNTQTDEFGRTMAQNLKRNLSKYTMRDLDSKHRDSLRRPMDPLAEQTINQIKQKAMMETEMARAEAQAKEQERQAMVDGALQYAAAGGKLNKDITKIVEEEYAAAYGGYINPKKYKGLNMPYSSGGKLPKEVLRARVESHMSPEEADAYVENYAKGGGIHIKESKKGTFTAAATKHGKSVQEFARQVLANKGNYSSAMVKKANFSRNAAKWQHAEGGPMVSNIKQPFEVAAQNRGGMMMNYAMGGNMYAMGGPGDKLDPEQLKAQGFVEYEEYFYNPTTGQYIDKPSDYPQDDIMYQKNIERFMEPGIQFDERTIKPLTSLIANSGIEQLPIDTGMTTLTGGVKKPGMENVIGPDSYIEGTRTVTPRLHFNSSPEDYSGKYNLQYVDPYTLGGDEMLDQRYPILDRDNNIQLTPDEFDKLQTVGSRSDMRSNYFKQTYNQIQSTRDKVRRAYQNKSPYLDGMVSKPATPIQPIERMQSRNLQQLPTDNTVPGIIGSEENSINFSNQPVIEEDLQQLYVPQRILNQSNTSGFIPPMVNANKKAGLGSINLETFEFDKNGNIINNSSAEPITENIDAPVNKNIPSELGQPLTGSTSMLDWGYEGINSDGDPVSINPNMISQYEEGWRPEGASVSNIKQSNWYEEPWYNVAAGVGQIIPSLNAMREFDKMSKRKLTPEKISPSKVNLERSRITSKEEGRRALDSGLRTIRGGSSNTGQLAANTRDAILNYNKNMGANIAKLYETEENTNAQLAQQAALANQQYGNAFKQLNEEIFQAGREGFIDASQQAASIGSQNVKSLNRLRNQRMQIANMDTDDYIIVTDPYTGLPARAFKSSDNTYKILT